MTPAPMDIETPCAPLLDLLVKSAALIPIGTALIVALRKASAANRHAASVAKFTARIVKPDAADADAPKPDTRWIFPKMDFRDSRAVCGDPPQTLDAGVVVRGVQM